MRGQERRVLLLCTAAHQPDFSDLTGLLLILSYTHVVTNGVPNGRKPTFMRESDGREAFVQANERDAWPMQR